MKQVISKYTFNPVAKTITFREYDTIDLSRLALVTNVTRGTIIYQFNNAAKGGTVSGNVLTLAASTAGMQATDKLRIDYDAHSGDPVTERVVMGNAQRKFRDSFAASGVQPNPDVWDLVWNPEDGHIIDQGGDSAGSSYLRISLSPFAENSFLRLTSKQTFTMPMRVGYGVTLSQRFVGQDVFVGLASVNDDGQIETIPAPVDTPLTGTTATIASNVGTFTLDNHGLKGGDRITIVGCAEKRLNVGPVIVTPLTANTFSVPVTLANGTYSTVGGFIRNVDPMLNSKNAAGLLFDSATSTNASFVARRNGAKYRLQSTTIGTTTATQGNTSAYSDAFNAATNHELYYSLDEVSWRSYAADSTAAPTQGKFTDAVPDEGKEYKLQIHARRVNGITIPIGRVVNAVKSGSTTATITTDVPHGLAVGDYVQVYGVQNSATTAFPNLTAQTAVASVPSATTFTVVQGTSGTATSSGGVVFQNQGSVLAPGIISANIQSVSRTSNVMTVIAAATISGLLPGEYIQLHGLTNASVDGAYKVLRVSTTTLEVESVGPDFTSISTGGAIIKRTDIRLHYARLMDYTRLVTEIVGGKGGTDANNAVPVTIASAVTQAVSQSTGSATSTWNAAGHAGTLVADIASAAITTTATSSAITPGSPANMGVYSNAFNVNVTAASGTNRSLDVSIEESPDGTNWFRIYDFPRITEIGSYVSPQIKARWGYRYRYVRTVAGTSPSFTMVLNRLQFSTQPPSILQFFDRTIVPTTLNSTTPAYFVDSCDRFSLFINLGAATTPPAIQLEGSEDGTAWYAIDTPLTGAANSTVVKTILNEAPKWVRARVSTAGAAVTLGYVSIKARE